MKIDHSPRGLLVPGWSKAGRLALVVSPDHPDAEDCAGLTLTEVAKRRQVSKETAYRWLFEGIAPPPGGGRPGRRQAPETTAWMARHFEPGATIKDAARHFSRSTATVKRWIEHRMEPLASPPVKASSTIGDFSKGYRGPKPAVFIRQWMRNRCPPELQDVPILAVAKAYNVTPTAVRGWAKHDLDPVVGGYKTGHARPKPKKARARPKAAAKPKPEPAAVMTPEQRERLRAAFVAELHARKPFASRLTRIFTAEIRPL